MLNPEDSRYLARLMPYVRRILSIEEGFGFSMSVDRFSSIEELPNKYKDIIKEAEELRGRFKKTGEVLF